MRFQIAEIRIQALADMKLLRPCIAQVGV